jgi:hypothetical protein
MGHPAQGWLGFEVSHPFRRSKRKGWGTEDYNKNKNALEKWDDE